jgi:diadenosine tetraphosphate (Ap4A) HIT family hydrolase
MIPECPRYGHAGFTCPRRKPLHRVGMLSPIIALPVPSVLIQSLSMSAKTCPFCVLDPARILVEDELCVVYKDGFPVSPGHTVVIPKRHFPTLFEATEAEQMALLRALNHCKTLLDELHHPDGYNIGINHGTAGGQSVPHLHIHVIPRYLGDKADPKGGVRWVLPEKAKYWT